MKYESDIEKMKVALEQAKLAYQQEEIPVGAALFNKENGVVGIDSENSGEVGLINFDRIQYGGLMGSDQNMNGTASYSFL